MQMGVSSCGSHSLFDLSAFAGANTNRLPLLIVRHIEPGDGKGTGAYFPVISLVNKSVLPSIVNAGFVGYGLSSERENLMASHTEPDCLPGLRCLPVICGASGKA